MGCIDAGGAEDIGLEPTPHQVSGATLIAQDLSFAGTAQGAQCEVVQILQAPLCGHNMADRVNDWIVAKLHRNAPLGSRPDQSAPSAEKVATLLLSRFIQRSI